MISRGGERHVPRSLTASLYACFFLSGAAGLVYEIVWMRMLSLVFGHTVFAITTVLAAFMAGLALGAAVAGRLIDRRPRPLLVYGLLEAATGLYALAIPFLFAQAQTVYLVSYRSLGFSLAALLAAQFAIVFPILLVPASFMGATLPVMSKFFVRGFRGLGRDVADLYALNTFGAVLGSAAAGFFLLPAIGVRSTTILAAAVNVAIGGWALMADRFVANAGDARAARPPAAEAPAFETRPDESAARVQRLVLAGIFLSGVASMICEITWTRALSLVIGSSVYAFSAMLTTFLVGLALGSFVFARIWGKRVVGTGLFGWLEVAAGLSALALVPALQRMPELVLTIMKRISPSATAAMLSQFSLSFLAMIVPTTIIGAALPCAIQISARALPRLGRDIGRVYSANTVGTIAGALLAGYALVPALGVQASMIAAAGVNIAVGAAVLGAGARPGWRRAAAVPAVALFAAGALFLPRWDPRVMVAGVSVYAHRFTMMEDPWAQFRRNVASRRLLFYREGINSTVSVERSERMTSLRVDGKVDASNGVDMATQLMLGHLPLFLHPRPERVLVIGLGSGVTAGAVGQHPVVREIDVVELEPAVVEASRFFIHLNRGILRDPRLRLVIGDGRNFILASPKKYDVIVSEPSNPWMAGVANLFSREFYRLARQRLADGGMMVQWFHGYSLFPRELRMIANTFRRVFPHATLWRTIRGDYLLVGTGSPLILDLALLERRIAASTEVQADMAGLRLTSPLDLLSLFQLDEVGLARFVEGASENTDDRPLLEFSAPLALYADTTDLNASLLREARTAEFPAVAHLPAGSLAARRVHFARLCWARGEREEALDHLRNAPPPDPRDTDARLERAKLLFALGEVTQATQELARLATSRPGDRLVASYQKAGGILHAIGAEEAVVQHGRARLGDPNPAEAHNNLGVFYTQLGIRFNEPVFFDLAVDSLEAARRVEPDASPVLNNLANAYFELGRLEEASRAYRQVIGLAPDVAEARFNLGLVYEKQGRLDLAVRELETASRLKPDWTLPRMRLAQMRRGPALPAEAVRPRSDAPATGHSR